jgi:hypothetical protein
MRGIQPRARAEARITVEHTEATPYDDRGNQALVEIALQETFAGGIDGQSTVRALQFKGADGMARMVSMQRFCGKLDGREGTFVLQGSESIQGGRITATWFVLPGSATGELSGLRGEGGFEGDFGKGSSGFLDYWFE